MPPKTITVIGSLNTDLVSVTARVPSGGETLTGTSFHTGPGGKGANQAVAAARLSRANPHSDTGLKSKDGDKGDDVDIVVKMVGAVGNDEFGPKIIAGMKDDGIDVTGIEIVKDQPTGVAVIIVESTTGENRILLNPGANSTLQPSSFLPSSSPSPFNPPPHLLILQLEIPLPTLLQIITTATASSLTPKIPILLNPAPAVPLPDTIYPSITHLILNESEAALLTNRSVEEVEDATNFDWSVVTGEFIAKGVRNVVVTLGSKGAFWASSPSSSSSSVAASSSTEKPAGSERKIRSGFVPAEKVPKVVDTTAAGDTFVGAYAVAVVRAAAGGDGEIDLDLDKVVRWACKASARTVQKEGAQGSIPWADEV